MSPCSVELYLHSSSPASQICARPSLPLCLWAWFCSQVRADAHPGPEQQMQDQAVPGWSWLRLEAEPRERRRSCSIHSSVTASTKSTGMLLWGTGTGLGTTGFKGSMLGRVRGRVSEGCGVVLHRINEVGKTFESHLWPNAPMALSATSSLFLNTSRDGDSQHLPGQPIPMPSPSFWEEFLPYVQPTLLLVQLKAVSPSLVAGFLGEENNVMQLNNMILILPGIAMRMNRI